MTDNKGEVMVVGVAEVSLSLPGAQSLKDKRRVIKSLVTRCRQKWNVSAAEVEDNDLWQRAVLGLAVVANSGEYCHQVLQAAVRFLEGDPEVLVANVHISTL